MKKHNNWFENLIEVVHDRRNWLTSFIVILVVLFVGAGSLYMLLNTEG